MRKLNAILTAAILLLFILHGILGAFTISGIGEGAAKAAAWVCLLLTVFHMGIGVILTIRTLQAQKKAGAAYFRQNILFWARRISGLAVMVMLCFHLTAFERAGGAAYRLQNFNLFRLISQLLFVLSLAVHVLSNVRPLLISFGIRSLKERSPEILLTLAGILLFFAAAFIVYYLRWVRA